MKKSNTVKRLRFGTAITSTLVAMTISAFPALAQSLTDAIVVTAQKREQSAQDVGIAINAFSGEQLNALGVEDSTEIANYTPGVHTAGALAGQNTQFTIRGVTQNDFADIVETPNAVYLDDGYIAVAQGQTFATFDIARVEVLKGPQGTLFGRNATGGLVHYVSNAPVLGESEGFLDVTYRRFGDASDANGVRVEGAYNIPLGDSVALRASALYNYHEPLLRNLFRAGGAPAPFGPDGGGADIGNDDTLGGRLSLAFEPSEKLRGRLTVNGARSRLSTGPYQSRSTIAVYQPVGGSVELVNILPTAADETRFSILLDAAGNDTGGDFGTDQDNDGAPDPFVDPSSGAQRPLPGGDFFGYLDPDGDDFTTSSDFAFSKPGTVDTWGVGGKLEYDVFDSVLLTLISDFKSFDKSLNIDVDAAPINQLSNFAAVDATTVSQEVRLNGQTGSFTWQGGFYFLHIDSEADNGLKIPEGSIVPGGSIDIGVNSKLTTNSYSLFAQTEWEFAPGLKLITGIRGIQENKDFQMAQDIYLATVRSANTGVVLAPGGPFSLAANNPFTQDTDDTHWAGKVQLEYTPTSSLLLYAGVNRGVKAGSFNAPIPGGLAIPNFAEALSYDREVLVSYEGGFKLSFWEDRARLNATGYYYDYSDYQSFLFTGVSGIVINADADNVGGEIELQANPVEGLDVIIGLAAFDATVKDVPLRIGGPISRDVDPTYAPEIQANAVVRYEWPAFGGDMAVLGSYSYSDEFYYNLRNYDADKFDEYHLLKARVSWVDAEERFELAMGIDNILDDRIGVQGFSLSTLCGCNETSFQPPRSFYVSVRANF